MDETMPLDPIELERAVVAQPEPEPQFVAEPEPESEAEPEFDQPRRGLFGRRAYTTPRERKRGREVEPPSYARKDSYVPWSELPGIPEDSAIEDASHDAGGAAPSKPDA